MRNCGRFWPGSRPAGSSPPAGSRPLLDAWRRLARERLLTALDDAFGAAGPGVGIRALITRGTTGAALVEIADREDDLLVVGAGRRSALHRAVTRSVSHYCLTHAACPVLAVPPSPLESDLAAVHRRNAWRLRLDTRHLVGGRTTAPPDA